MSTASEFCTSCQTTHTRERGCQCARCGTGMHPLFICCISGLNGEKLAWCPNCDEMLSRACDPRVGDRLRSPGGESYVQVTSVLTHPRHHLDPDGNGDVEFDRINGKETSHARASIGYWRSIASKSIKGGYTFHTVEDEGKSARLAGKNAQT